MRQVYQSLPLEQARREYHHLVTRAAALSAIARKLLLWADAAVYGKHPYYKVDWLGYTNYRVGSRK